MYSTERYSTHTQDQSSITAKLSCPLHTHTRAHRSSQPFPEKLPLKNTEGISALCSCLSVSPSLSHFVSTHFTYPIYTILDTETLHKQTGIVLPRLH